ncbi:MAG: hypothetical protein KKC46_08995, partial [Proteobacteria bacterium]|nr:hypothetical protein [Pseudomonadota bacterium]
IAYAINTDSTPASLHLQTASHENAIAIGKCLCCGSKTATIAPDGGSHRIRDVINKGITEDHILSATQIIVGAGIPNFHRFKKKLIMLYCNLK